MDQWKLWSVTAVGSLIWTFIVSFLNDNSVTRKCYNCSFKSFFLESMSDLVLYLAILTLVFFIKWNCVRIFMKKYQGRSITWFLHEVKWQIFSSSYCFHNPSNLNKLVLFDKFYEMPQIHLSRLNFFSWFSDLCPPCVGS